MRLRQLFLAALGSLVVVSGTNALLAQRASDLTRPVAGREETYRWHGLDVTYTTAGHHDEPTVLLVHGVHVAGTSHEFNSVMELLADQYHVIAPDLPGFGRTDRPPITYDADLYCDFIADFSADIAPDATCIASSLAGAHAAIAVEDGAPLSRLVLICPTATTAMARRPRYRAILRSPVVGTAIFNAIASKPSLRWYGTEYAYSSPAALSEVTVEYWWETTHQPGARFAPASFLSGYLDPHVDLGTVLAGLARPVTLVWGRDTTITPLSYGEDLAEAGDTDLVVFDQAKLLPHVEYPDQFTEVVSDSL